MKQITSLTEKQEERIIKNCVECIMDDLDDYYFDEMFMDWFKKNIHNFLKEKFKIGAGFSFPHRSFHSFSFEEFRWFLMICVWVFVIFLDSERSGVNQTLHALRYDIHIEFPGC